MICTNIPVSVRVPRTRMYYIVQFCARVVFLMIWVNFQRCGDAKSCLPSASLPRDFQTSAPPFVLTLSSQSNSRTAENFKTFISLLACRCKSTGSAPSPVRARYRGSLAISNTHLRSRHKMAPSSFFFNTPAVPSQAHIALAIAIVRSKPSNVTIRG
jgi:hypothetical protein